MSSIPWAGRHDALPEEVRQALGLGADIRVLDVRTAAEYSARHIPNAVLIPLNELAGRAVALEPEAHWVVVCEHGIRSRAATNYLLQNGFENACNMLGGMSSYDGPVESGPPKRA